MKEACLGWAGLPPLFKGVGGRVLVPETLTQTPAMIYSRRSEVDSFGTPWPNTRGRTDAAASRWWGLRAGEPPGQPRRGRGRSRWHEEPNADNDENDDGKGGAGGEGIFHFS